MGQLSSVFSTYRSKASKSPAFLNRFILPTPRLSTWNTIPPGAIRAVLGIPPLYKGPKSRQYLHPPYLPRIFSPHTPLLFRPAPFAFPSGSCWPSRLHRPHGVDVDPPASHRTQASMTQGP